MKASKYSICFLLLVGHFLEMLDLAAIASNRKKVIAESIQVLISLRLDFLTDIEDDHGSFSPSANSSRLMKRACCQSSRRQDKASQRRQLGIHFVNPRFQVVDVALMEFGVSELVRVLLFRRAWRGYLRADIEQSALNFS